MPKRASWSEAALQHALQDVRGGMSVLAASREYAIPRRTLRNHIATGSTQKKLGRRSLLTTLQERELCQRIFRLANVGMPLTGRVLRRSVFTFVEELGIQHPFSQDTRMAGRRWINLFYKRNPDVTQRKSQPLNPARAQKMNRAIVGDYFKKLKQVLTDLNVADKPHLIYNMDEKGCRLTLHHQQQVLAQRGTKRVHIIAPEHAENVTVVACGNALGQSIPPMILFKGKRRKEEWIDSMPPGTLIEMTAKGSMTTETFIKWIAHFVKYKSPEPCLLIFDGAASHLDCNIVTAAEAHNVTLLCLPSNTTHELQPLDKSVFRSFEHFWDDEVLKYWVTEPDRKITRARFGKILSAVWPKAMSPTNLMSGFRATGIYPFNPDVIPESAFAPSILTERNQPLQEKTRHVGLEDHEHDTNHLAVAANDLSDSDWSESDQIPLSIIHKRLLQSSSTPKTNVNSPKPSCSWTVQNSPELPFGRGSTHELSLSPINNNNVDNIESLNPSVTFTELLPTPEIKVSIKPRRKAINSSAQVITKDLFNKENNKATSKLDIIRPSQDLSKVVTNKTKKPKDKESWYCYICSTEKMLDMRRCCTCFTYVHEECVGLTKEDKLAFVCPNCAP